jgi:hypothetical protein
MNSIEKCKKLECLHLLTVSAGCAFLLSITAAYSPVHGTQYTGLHACSVSVASRPRSPCGHITRLHAINVQVTHAAKLQSAFTNDKAHD